MAQLRELVTCMRNQSSEIGVSFETGEEHNMHISKVKTSCKDFGVFWEKSAKTKSVCHYKQVNRKQLGSDVSSCLCTHLVTSCWHSDC